MHKNSRLTEAQRKIIQTEVRNRTSTQHQLAKRFGVSRATIQRWAHRDEVTDRRSGPKNPRRVVTAEYRQAVINYRLKHSDRGPITIAAALKEEFPFANRGTVLRILQQEQLCGTKKKVKGQKKDL